MIAAVAARVLTALPWLPSAWSWIKLGTFGLLIILCAWLRHDNARLAAERDAEAAAHALTMARYTQAQDVAARVAEENKLRKETADETARLAADAELEPLRARYRDAILRAKAAPAERVARRADLPRTAATAQGPDGPSAGAGVPFGSMIVTHEDALICADNTVRLQVARDWGFKVALP